VDARVTPAHDELLVRRAARPAPCRWSGSRIRS